MLRFGSRLSARACYRLREMKREHCGVSACLYNRLRARRMASYCTRCGTLRNLYSIAHSFLSLCYHVIRSGLEDERQVKVLVTIEPGPYLLTLSLTNKYMYSM